jgi:hypothetical protein
MDEACRIAGASICRSSVTFEPKASFSREWGEGRRCATCSSQTSFHEKSISSSSAFAYATSVASKGMSLQDTCTPLAARFSLPANAASFPHCGRWARRMRGASAATPGC